MHAWFLQGLGASAVVQANAAAAVQTAVEGRLGPREPAVVSGHFAYGVHERLAGHPHRYVILLRDPVQRVLSLFRYIRSMPTHKVHTVMNRPDMTIARFYADLIPGGGVRNATVAQLSGVLGLRIVPVAQHLELASARLLGRDAMFGLAENPEPLLKQAAKLLEIEELPTFPEVNRLAAGEQWGGSEEDIAAIVAGNQLDIELYRRAKVCLSR